MPGTRLSREAGEFLRRVPAKHGRQLVAKIEALARDPRPPDAKQLKGHPQLLRADAGEYRIIYRVADDTLFVELIGKRNDDEIYRQMRRKF